MQRSFTIITVICTVLLLAKTVLTLSLVNWDVYFLKDFSGGELWPDYLETYSRASETKFFPLTEILILLGMALPLVFITRNLRKAPESFREDLILFRPIYLKRIKLGVRRLISLILNIPILIITVTVLYFSIFSLVIFFTGKIHDMFQMSVGAMAVVYGAVAVELILYILISIINWLITGFRSS